MDFNIVSLSEHRNRKYDDYCGGRWYRRETKDTPSGNSRVYVDVQGESFWENFENRTTRPHTLWRPAVIQALTEGFVPFTKLVWSQKAGCSCPCSPGFYIHGHRGSDFFLTLELAPEDTVKHDDNAELEQLMRRVSVANDPTLTGAR